MQREVFGFHCLKDFGLAGSSRSHCAWYSDLELVHDQASVEFQTEVSLILMSAEESSKHGKTDHEVKTTNTTVALKEK